MPNVGGWLGRRHDLHPRLYRRERGAVDGARDEIADAEQVVVEDQHLNPEAAAGVRRDVVEPAGIPRSQVRWTTAPAGKPRPTTTVTTPGAPIGGSSVSDACEPLPRSRTVPGEPLAPWAISRRASRFPDPQG